MRFSTKPRSLAVHVGAFAFCASAFLGLGHLFAAGTEPSPATQPSSAGTNAHGAIRYGRDIRPILSDRCFKCHGQDAKSRSADLRLDLREQAISKREAATAPIVPGHPDASEVWRRITSDDPNVRMPPPESNKRPISAQEREFIKQWIAEGAPYEPHWAFQPPKRAPLPEVQNAAWCRNPVDRFILARLDEKGMKPSPDADRPTLIRRAFLDVTGLPPTPEEIDAFMADNRPDAYERWIDKLLTEEPYRTRYAERMAVPWLDAARYADTCGIHMDAGRQTWLWRDWVINAYRNNMPFDQFVTDQIAGDLLPNATDQQKIASGFNRNHITSDEGGAIAEEYLVEYAVDRASTTGEVFMGLTVGCARCHEHKYDPISQEEFYRFYSFFNSIEEPGLYSQSPDPNRAHEPFLVAATSQQKAELADLGRKIAGLKAEFAKPHFQEDLQRQAYIVDKQKTAGLVWEPTQTTAAGSVFGATLSIQDDGSVLASGSNPERDEHIITLQTDARDLRLLMLEAMTDRSLPQKGISRTEGNNVVLTGIDAEARSITHPDLKTPVHFVWAWADVEQNDGDFHVINVLDDRDDRGWAVNGHMQKGGRLAMLLADKPFGFEGGTEVRVRLQYNSMYPQYVFGRVRLTLGRIADAGLDLLPAEPSGWYVAGPFAADFPETAYKTAYGPEKNAKLDLQESFGTANLHWRYDENVRDEQINPLPEGVSATYVGRRVLSPSDRKFEVSLGSDDGFALFVNGKQVAEHQVNRGIVMDQDKAVVELHAGENSIVMKVVNTSGYGAFSYRTLARADELFGDLVAALVPESARTMDVQTRLSLAWKLAYSPGYTQQKTQLAKSEARISEIDVQAPRTMVMKELPAPRETFVLVRGQYDHPDKNRPVTRGIPAALGKLPAKAPANRLGLAEWMTSPDNPLVARVAVNHLWETLLGTGLVRTSEDFGFQGEWPSHPELIDWLAVEFRESGWDVQHMLKLILTSSTYRQSSRVRSEYAERDPDNRLLTYYPRRRLPAEFVRDQALYVAGLLVEKMGGPSVKPYQPDGLWQEVAMLQSNTRIYERGAGNELWRRSMYTYWKRACPPPSMLTFDAPTREACVIRRPATNTPLQALVLWNDEQFVEAARVLAQRTLKEQADDRDRITSMFRRCTGRMPGEDEIRRLTKALTEFRDRYKTAPDDATKLLQVGVSPMPKDAPPPELAAWTMIANALLNLSATMTQG